MVVEHKELTKTFRERYIDVTGGCLEQSLIFTGKLRVPTHSCMEILVRPVSQEIASHDSNVLAIVYNILNN